MILKATGYNPFKNFSKEWKKRDRSVVRKNCRVKIRILDKWGNKSMFKIFRNNFCAE